MLQAKYIAQCIEEVKQELRQDNINVKCNAVAKLTYVSGELIFYVFQFVNSLILQTFTIKRFKCSDMTYPGLASTLSK